MPKIVDYIKSGLAMIASATGFKRAGSKREAVRAMPSSNLIKDDNKSVTDWFNEHRSCPDCGGYQFLEGPKGGICQNIECGNRECGSRYNVAMLQGHVLFAHRILEATSSGRTLH